MHAPAVAADDDTERPSWACILHAPPRYEDQQWIPAHQGYVTCDSCLLRLREVMRDVGKRYRKLDPTPGRGGDGARGAPGFASRSPASEHVIAFTDPRSSQTAKTWRDRAGRLCCEDERPPVSVRGELDILAWDVAEALGLAGPHERADVDDLLRHLDARLDLVTRDAGLVERVALILRALQATLRPLTGDPRPRYIGHCQALIEELDEQGVPVVCDARLHAPLKGSEVRCRECSAVWPRERWLELGRALQVAVA